MHCLLLCPKILRELQHLVSWQHGVRVADDLAHDGCRVDARLRGLLGALLLDSLLGALNARLLTLAEPPSTLAEPSSSSSLILPCGRRS